MKKTRFREFLKLVGPYDFNGGLILASVFFLMLAGMRSYVYDYDDITSRLIFFSKSVLIVFIILLPVPIIYFAFKYLWRRFRIQRTLYVYLCEVCIFVLMNVLCTSATSRWLIPVMHIPDFLRVRNTFFLIFIRLLFSLLFIGFTHHSHRKLQENLAEVSNLNALLSREYHSIIEADENVRGQAVQFLHDRVQGQLMMASLKLREIGSDTSESIQVDINSVASHLEKLRSTDIRLVSRLLSPNIDGEGLHGVIESLCEQFSLHTGFEISFDEKAILLDQTINLGVYRLIEQAVINSITHGPANHVKINVENRSSHQIMVQVADDGPGSESAQMGTGTIIMDAWLSKLRGYKEIFSEPGTGYAVKFIIPLEASTSAHEQ